MSASAAPAADRERLFEGRTGIVLGAVIAVGLAVTLFFTVFAPDPVTGGGPPPAGADTFSRSAIGYRGLVRLLEAELPVLVSRGYSAAKGSPERALVLFEPEPDGDLGQRFAELVAAAEKNGVPLVVALPKWRGRRAADRPAWIDAIEERPQADAERVLAALMHGDPAVYRVRRPASASGWRSELGGPAPELPRPQLLAPVGALVPLIAAGEGVLVAKVDGSPVWVVADPDLLNNAGLARGANAVIAHRLLVDELGAGALIVDESLHGYPPPATLWQALLRFPLLCFSLQLAALTGLAVWAGAGRFGRPLPPPSRLPPGQWTLVDNTARLLAVGRRPGSAAERYFHLVVERTAAALHLPPGLDPEQRLRELHRLSRLRGVEPGIAALRAELNRLSAGAEPRRVVAFGQAVHRWHQEIVDAR